MAEPRGPTEGLLRQTGRRLSIVTFGLVATLVVGVGTVTAVVGLAALDADVDRSLASAVASAAAQAPSSSDGESGEVDDVEPASADTFVLYLDAGGAVVANPSRIGLAGLPVTAAVTALGSGGAEDWRTVDAGGLSVRLLTVPVRSGEDGGARFVQGGFVLTLHDQQSRSLVVAIVGTGAAGLLAAAIVTLLVTRRALAPIRRSIEAQHRFVADASHELRTPAAIIRASAEVLQREGHVSPEGASIAADIVDESARLGRLVEDLLAIASADARGMPLRLERLDLAAVVDDTSRAVAPLATAHDVRLVVGAAPSTVVVGDPDRLAQVLVVLLDNAIGHSPPGGTVEIGLARSDHDVVLTVQDQGPGVAAGDRARIFEPFTRAAAARRGGSRGSGLGLAIAAAIVRGHRGSIGVDDAPGGGARFTVTLPVD